MAGLTTGVMLVPQGLAYALVASLDPIVGLYACWLPTLVRVTNTLVAFAMTGHVRPPAVSHLRQLERASRWARGHRFAPHQ